MTTLLLILLGASMIANCALYFVNGGIEHSNVFLKSLVNKLYSEIESLKAEHQQIK